MAASDSIKKCQHCSADSPAEARFCPRCGKPLTDQLIRSATKVTPLMQQWRKLSHALTRKDVRKLLGEPIRIELDSPKQAGPHAEEHWIYEYHSTAQPTDRVRGEATFSAAEGRILHWTEPDFSAIDVNP
jgi:hypothetical protein